MKVLHLLESSRFSGAENVVCQIISMFQNDSNIEMVYCSRDGEVRKALEERNIQFAPLSAFTISEIKRVIRAQNPDIIHAHDMRASFYAAMMLGKAKLISHIHNNAYDSRGWSLKSVAYYLAAIKAKHIFWVSSSAFSGYAFHRELTNKSSVLYNVINIEELYEKMEADNNTYDYDVVYVGRLVYPKNPERMIEVLSQLIEQRPQIKVAIVGTGDLEENVRQLVQEKHISRNIDFLGFQQNPLKIMNDAKCMLMTSRWEGTPMCALEAMSLGLPIVSTPTDGMKELVSNGETGFLAESDGELVKAICRIVDNSDVYEALSLSSISKAKKMMDVPMYKEKILKTYLK